MRKPAHHDLARVAVVGNSCTGKTTLARQLAAALRVPHIELDAIYWQKDWQPRTREDFRRLVGQAVVRDRWITDGNYGVVRDIVWPRATAVVWLNYSFPLVAGRALARTLRRSLTRAEVFSGNRESFRRSFLSRDSILLWVLTSFRRRRKLYAELARCGQFPGTRFYEFRRPAEAEVFLAEVRGAAPALLDLPEDSDGTEKATAQSA